ncbi:hypothetical protein BGW80DRAFT_382508 [Lactifluus volemus]|nr:hypothetical protein BGW80DRAFT_382508 [Lactifluus volemus]
MAGFPLPNCLLRRWPLSAPLSRSSASARAHQTFVPAVLGVDSQSRDSDMYDTKKDVCKEEDRYMVVEAGQSMGGRTADLVDLLERV